MITLNVAVRGSSPLTRMNDGHCLGPRSSWAERNSLKVTGSKSAPTSAAITRSPTVGSGTP
ncbi:Uncharacterised protein [Mycobacteroides abscessus subsp. abscessus]|nr:Uncharacterised protein [Mycobacteroides abscessus subsp. abscessus]